MKKSLKIREKYVIKFKTLKIMTFPLFYNNLCKFYSTPDFIEPFILSGKKIAEISKKI